jgi:hypothetical protein
MRDDGVTATYTNAGEIAGDLFGGHSQYHLLFLFWIGWCVCLRVLPAFILYYNNRNARKWRKRYDLLHDWGIHYGDIPVQVFTDQDRYVCV